MVLLFAMPSGVWAESWQSEHEETQRLLNVRDESIPTVHEQYERAIKSGMRALELAMAEYGPVSPYTAISYCEVGTGYSVLGAYNKALPYLEQGFETFRKLTKDQLTNLKGANLTIWVSCMHQFGNVLMHTGKVDRRIEWYKSWLESLQKNAAKNTPFEADVLFGLSDSYAAKGEFQEALRVRMQGLTLYESHGQTATVEYVLSKIQLADAYYQLGENAKTVETLEKLSIQLETLKATHGYVYAFLTKELGTKYIAIGQRKKGVAMLEKATPLLAKNFGTQSPYYLDAKKWLVLARWGTTKNSDEALDELAFLEAELTAALGSNHPAVGNINMLQGISYLASDNPTDALMKFTTAESTVSKSLGMDHHTLGTLAALKASAKAMSGSSKDSLILANEAVSLTEVNFEISNQIRALNYFLAAYAYHESGNDDVAIVLLKNAVNAHQIQRADMGKLGVEAQTAYISMNTKVYQALADLLVQQDRIEEAQIVLDLLKANEYYEYTNRSGKTLSDRQGIFLTNKEAVALEEYQRQIKELRQLNVERAVLAQDPSKNSEALAINNQRIRVVNEQISTLVVAELKEDFLRNQAQRSAENKEISGQAMAEKAHLVGQLGKDVALAQYYVTDERVGVLLTTPTGRLARAVSIKRKDLNKKISTLLSLLKDPKTDSRQSSQALYEVLIAPIEKDLQASGTKTLMVSLDDRLRYIPFAALYDGQDYLIARFAFPQYSRISQSKIASSPVASWNFVGLGVTKPWGDYPPLPEVKTELNSIVKSSGGVLSGRIYLDDAFTKPRFFGVAKQGYSVVHVASHFVVSPGTESNSFLLLGDGGQLTLEEIRKQNYRFDGTELLTLSACETGIGGGRDADGKEIDGFGLVAQQQGAKAVLATLWKVNDKSTAVLMADMYAQKVKGKNKIEALRQAQIDLKQKPEYSHPYFWAPFILMGNWQ